MAFIQQCAQGLVSAQQWVDLVVVVGVVAVVGCRLEHRREVDGVAAQRLDMVEVLECSLSRMRSLSAEA